MNIFGEEVCAMSTVVQRRRELNIFNAWNWFCKWITNTENRLYISWFCVLMIPTMLVVTTCFIVAFIAAQLWI